MKTGPLTLVLAAVMAAGSVAQAQPYDPADQRYQQEVDDYQARRDAYEDRRDDYQQQSSRYENQREAYEQARARYEADKRDYDARYGYGAYERRYGVFRYDYDNDYAWDNRYRSDNYRGYSSSDRYYDRYRDSPCERRRSDNTAIGGVIGALAGAAIGSNVAARNARTEGAILGAVVGGVAGGAIGRSTANCDGRGYYYSYNQTYPYREDSAYYGRRSGRYDYRYYSSRRCRLAIAPAYYGGTMEERYVRVCPDRSGRYRITD